jgi:hypothetical protein
MIGSRWFQIGAVPKFEDVLVLGAFLKETLLERGGVMRFLCLNLMLMRRGSVRESLLFGSVDLCAAELLLGK